MHYLKLFIIDNPYLNSSIIAKRLGLNVRFVKAAYSELNIPES